MSDLLVLTETKAVRIHLDGFNELSTKDYASLLIGFEKILNSICKTIYPEKQLLVLVKGQYQGSFVIELIIGFKEVQAASESLYNFLTSDKVANLVTIVAGIFAFTKFLKGMRPIAIKKNVNQGNVTYTNFIFNEDTYHEREDLNGTTVADIFLENETIRADIAYFFESLTNINNLKKFTYSVVNKQIRFSCSISDIELMAEPIDINPYQSRLVEETVDLILELEKDNPTDLLHITLRPRIIYNDQFYPVDILDTDTLKNIEEVNKSFALIRIHCKVRLRILQRYFPDIDRYGDEDFAIINFISIYKSSGIY